MKKLFGYLLLCFVISSQLFASESRQEGNKEEEFDPTELIMHHIADSYVWHVISWGEAEHHFELEIPLPIILINNGKFHFFLYSRFDHESHIAESNGEYFILSHGKIYNTDSSGTIKHDDEGHILNSRPLDFSLTKNVWSMWLSVALLVWIFLSVANKYKGNPSCPKGIQSLLEPIILFVKNDIVLEQIGVSKGGKYVPYLLTLFFFIWINNIIGLVPFFPGGSNFTGNISVTLVLAIITFIITNINGSKSYWKHTLTAPGVPVLVKIILIPVEFFGLFTKPFALMIRLLANITAGHIVMLSLVSLIFILKTVYISPVPIILGFVMTLLELFVGALQAYIFTLLSALFIGMAVVDDEH